MVEMRPRWQRYSWERTEVEIKRNLAKWHEEKKKWRWGSRWDINLDQIDMNFSHKRPSKASFSFLFFFKAWTAKGSGWKAESEDNIIIIIENSSLVFSFKYDLRNKKMIMNSPSIYTIR